MAARRCVEHICTNVAGDNGWAEKERFVETSTSCINFDFFH